MTGNQSVNHDARVSLSQIAELAGVGASAVSNWRRRFDDFPQPMGATADGKDLFALEAIQRWLEGHDRSIAGRRDEQRFFLAADLLRAEGPLGRITELLCAAASLAYVARAHGELPASNFLGISPRDLIRRLEAQDAQFSDLFLELTDVPDERVLRLFGVIGDLDADGLRAMFEWALSRRGRFVDTRTHDSIAGLLADLTEPGPMRVFDPAVGEAGFLLRMSRRASRASTYYGQEVNGATWRLSRQRLLVHDLAATVRLGTASSTMPSRTCEPTSSSAIRHMAVPRAGATTRGPTAAGCLVSLRPSPRTTLGSST